jgi:HSP20 family protein
MDLMPWKKKEGGELSQLRSELDRLFNRFFDMEIPFGRESLQPGQWTPRVDVMESPKEIRVKAEIPGMDAKDIEVTVEGRTLMIKGEKREEKVDKDENTHRVERRYGYFNRAIQLPAEVSPKAVEASYKKGVLQIFMTKVKPADVHRIEIKSS